MDDQAFQLILSELKDLKRKVDLLLEDKHRRNGAIVAISAMSGAVVTIIMKFIF